MRLSEGGLDLATIMDLDHDDFEDLIKGGEQLAKIIAKG